MKKFIALLLILIMALSFCACTNDEASNTDNSNDADKFIGTWVFDGVVSDIHQDGLFSFRLLPSGKVIWNAGGYAEGWQPGIVTEESDVGCGEWILDDKRIIIFRLSDDPDNGFVEETGAFVLKISDKNTLTWYNYSFSKAE